MSQTAVSTLPAALIIVAPNGAKRTRQDHSCLPDNPERMAECAASCVQAGAGMIHVHARDEQGAHTLDPDLNRAFYGAVNNAVGSKMLVQLTTEAVGRYSPTEQIDLVRQIKPMAASFALRELFPDAKTEQTSRLFFHELVEQQILVQIILYSPQEVVRYHQLKQQRVIPVSGHHLLFVLGRDGPQHPAALARFIAQHRDTTPWAVCAFGAIEYPAAVAALSMGGDVRVGFENNLTLRDGTQAPDNSALVRQIADMRQMLGRAVVDPFEFKRQCFLL